MGTYLKVEQKRRLPSVVMDTSRLELHVARFCMLHIKIEDDDVALKVMCNFDDVVKRCRSHPLDTLTEGLCSEFLFQVDLGCLLDFSERNVFAVESFESGGIFLSFFGFLQLFVGFGHNHGTVHAKLIVRGVDGNDAPTFPFLASHMPQRIGFDVVKIMTFAINICRVWG